MTDIDREIQRILQSQDQRVSEDVKKILRILDTGRSMILAEMASTPWEVYHLPRLRQAVEDQARNFANQARGMLGEGQIEMWGAGAAMVDQTLRAAGVAVVMPMVSTMLLHQLKDFSADKITGLSDVLKEKINTELALGMTMGKSPYEVSQAIGRNLEDASIFRSTAARAEVIVREEYGRTFSAARQERMMQAAESGVRGLKKIWRHAGHPRIPRETHVAADGQIVDVDQPFLVGGEPLLYPRDPVGAPENTINCGCQSLPYKEEWGIREAVIRHEEVWVYA